MPASLIRTILILPVNVVVVLPSILLWVSYRFFGKTALFIDVPLAAALGTACLLMGLVFAVTTVRLFVTIGCGTPAPWDPPKVLVVAGPYRYVRNPMISSVLVMLAGEALLFDSRPIFFLFCFFLVVNMVYLPLFEERALEARFGAEYREYKKHVPRWIPRLCAWEKRT